MTRADEVNEEGWYMDLTGLKVKKVDCEDFQITSLPIQTRLPKRIVSIFERP